MYNQTEIENIPFRNIGRKKQHKVTLIGYGECAFDFTKNQSDQSFAEKVLEDIHKQAVIYLKERGFNDTAGLFHIVNGKIERWMEGMPNKINAMPLCSIIKIRDKNEGLTGEFLAALIDHRCRTLLSAWPPPDHRWCSSALDHALEIQHYFFQLYLLDNVHLQYSAGKSRVDNANAETKKLKKKFGGEVKTIFQRVMQEEPQLAKCSRLLRPALIDTQCLNLF